MVWCGFGFVSIWFWYCLGIVLVWGWYGFGIVLSCFSHSCVMALVLFSYCVGIV